MDSQSSEATLLKDHTLLKVGSHKLQYARDSVLQRAKIVSQKTETPFSYLTNFSVEPEKWKGNIENLIGACQIPVGIAGPLRINGQYAKGDFYVPLATTEGALVMTYHRGMRVITKAGGAKTAILKDETHIDPAFYVSDLDDALKISTWIKEDFLSIKLEAEKTTSHGKLLRIDPQYVGRLLILKFVYFTADAHGLNMINRSTEAACQYIKAQTGRKFILRSNFSSVKKVSYHNTLVGYGKAVFAEVLMPRRMLRLLEVTPEDFEKFCKANTLASIHAGMVGMNAHTANGVAAMFIACGQDVADVSTAYMCISTCEVTENGDLYAGIYMPNLLLGTVGGGTGVGTQRECLQMLGCYGEGKVRKFAEIVAATVLAGEIAVVAALVNETYVQAHERYGRNKPEEKE